MAQMFNRSDTNDIFGKTFSGFENKGQSTLRTCQE